jgi:hypothetical protein
LNIKKLVLDDVSQDNAANTFTVTLTNQGDSPISALTFAVSGTHAAEFSVDHADLGLPLSPGQSISFNVNFQAVSNGIKTALLTIDANNGGAIKELELRGLGKTGIGGSREPSLQRILDAHGIDVDVNDDDPETFVINSDPALQKAPLLGDEVTAQAFTRVNNEPVTIEVLAVYGPTDNNPVVGFGWYKDATPATLNELFTVSNTPAANGQSLNVSTTGSLSFDPGQNVPFGFYNRWPFFSNRHVYSSDRLNTFTGAIPHHMRVYPLPGEANAYIIATEENPTGFDYQDIIIIARNVQPFHGTGGAQIAIENMTKIPGTTTGFPADDLFTFHRNKNATNTQGGTTNYHDSNIMRIHNKGGSTLNISNFAISSSQKFKVTHINGVAFTGSYPVSISPGGYKDVTIQFIDNSTVKGLKEETLTIHSNAGNAPALTALLKGALMLRVESSNELDAISIIRAFGFTTSMNDQPRPNSDYPDSADIDNGVYGDQILSETFVQADPAQPVRALQ